MTTLQSKINEVEAAVYWDRFLLHQQLNLLKSQEYYFPPRLIGYGMLACFTIGYLATQRHLLSKISRVIMHIQNIAGMLLSHL